MTTGMSFDGTFPGTVSFAIELASLAVIPVSDANFQGILPAAITYAENRIYRDLDLLGVNVPFYNATTTGIPTFAGSQFVSVPVDAVMVIKSVSAMTPPGTDVLAGQRVPLTPTSKEFIDAVYGGLANPGMPVFFAVIGQGLDPVTLKYSNQLMLGPAPDVGYYLDVYGTVHAPSLSATNNTTFISLYLPELMLMAAMVFISGYQRNWSGSSANDPQMPINYEMQYQTLLKGATMEEARKRFLMIGTPPAIAPAAPSVAPSAPRG